MPAGSVHVVIVNWNAGPLLKDCLSSFAAVAADAVRIERVTVVDNASSDGSADAAAEPADRLPVRVMHNARNVGFAAACNQGAAGAQADFLLFLNPDTMLRPGCLERPARFLADPARRAVGIVGVQLIDAAGILTRSCARRSGAAAMIGQSLGLDRLMPSLCRPHFLADWPHDETREVDQVSGAFLFMRRSTFEALGGFDTRFFVYFEDLDLALRARALGQSSVYLATAQVLHRGGGTTNSVKARRQFYLARSRIQFAFKHFGFARALAVAAATLVLEPICRLLPALTSGERGRTGDVLRGSAMLWADLPNIMRSGG
jgi:N-acetylglucosaminyl-diphospho-decaprenol L-rhamnosyltransferase